MNTMVRYHHKHHDRDVLRDRFWGVEASFDTVSSLLNSS